MVRLEGVSICMSELKAHKIKFFAFGYMCAICVGFFVFFPNNYYYEENDIAWKD